MKLTETLQKLKQDVYQANQDLVTSGLVLLTWGNASGYDPESGLAAIKPSGVDYKTMSADDMVLVNLDGHRVDGEYNPSSDTATHVAMYRAFPEIRGMVHTHSKWATAWAQACKDIPFLGTTHADNFYGDIPCTRRMTEKEINTAYEAETGNVIIETFNERGIDPLEVGAVIVSNHGPFSWGSTIAKAVENAIVMEYVAELAYISLKINPDTDMEQVLLDKHFLRKHGKNAYYGQK